MKPPNCYGNQLETGNGGHGVPERFEEKRKVPGGKNRGLTRMAADKGEAVASHFDHFRRERPESAFIGVHPRFQLRFIGISKQRA